MPKPEYRILDFEEQFSTIYGDTIEIPANTMFWRGYDPTYPTISSRPAYYGTEETANSYLIRKGHRLGMFTNTRKLELLDVRFLKALLKQLFESIQDTTDLTAHEQELIMSTTAAFGLCSLGHQIRLLKYIFSKNLKNLQGLPELEKLYNPKAAFEAQGVRVAETVNDGYTMAFLKGLFKGVAHGFISPRMETPYHIEKKGFLNPEMIIFDPAASGIQLLDPSINLQNVPTLSIYELMFKGRYHIVSLDYKTLHSTFYMSYGGGSRQKYLHPLDEFDEYMDSDNKYIRKLYKDGYKIGLKMNSKRHIFSAEPPVPNTPINPNMFRGLELE
jgi:hypothetical protein